MRTNRMRGFTLMELMTVVAIMGILLAVAMLGIRDYFERIKLRSAAEAIAAEIRNARWIAKTSADTCLITFQPATNSYMINGTQTAVLPAGLRFGTDPSVLGRPTAPSDPPPPDGISFDSGNSRNIARFYATGAVSPTGAVFLTDGTTTMAVTVSLYGRPKVWRSQGGRRWTAM